MPREKPLFRGLFARFWPGWACLNVVSPWVVLYAFSVAVRSVVVAYDLHLNCPVYSPAGHCRCWRHGAEHFAATLEGGVMNQANDGLKVGFCAGCGSENLEPLPPNKFSRKPG